MDPESPASSDPASEPKPTIETPEKAESAVITVDDERAPPARDGPLPVLEFVPTVPDLAFTMPKIIPMLSYSAVPPGPHQEFVHIEDWVRQIHPSGRVYIYNSVRRTVMGSDLYLVRDFVNRQTRVNQLSFPAMDELWDGLKTRLGDAFDADNYELFLKIDVLTDPESPKVFYYFAEWSSRTVFWLHEFTFEFHPISTRWHQRDMLECQFWAHVDYFPMHHSLPPNSREELEAVLAYQTVEAKTFRESTAPWKPEEAHMLAKTLPSIDFTTPLGRAFSRRPSLGSSATLLTSGVPGQFIPPHEGASNATVARLWRLIYILRVQHFYGDEFARIGRTERRRPTSGNEPPRWLRRFLSFFLFGRPPRFYSELQDVFVDEIMHLTHWRNFVEEEVQPEWTNNGFMATVMLAANMAFLALSGVDDGVTSSQIGCKILSLSSSIFSTSTLFSTMRLTAFHQHFKTATTDEAMWYMSECSSGPLGLFSVAMLFSVPFTTFMWSMLTFIAAILVFSFQHWSLNAGIPLIATTVVPVVGILSWMFWFFASWQRTRSGVKHEWAADHTPIPPPQEAPPVSAPGQARKRTSTFTKWLPTRSKSMSSTFVGDLERGAETSASVTQ